MGTNSYEMVTLKDGTKAFPTFPFGYTPSICDRCGSFRALDTESMGCNLTASQVVMRMTMAGEVPPKGFITQDARYGFYCFACPKCKKLNILVSRSFNQTN